MLDGLDSSNLAGSGLVQSGGCHWAHQISGSCWFYLIFCQFGVLRAQKLIKMCTKMLVFSVANSQNTYYGLKRVFFEISEIGTPPHFKRGEGAVCRKFVMFVNCSPRFWLNLTQFSQCFNFLNVLSNLVLAVPRELPRLQGNSWALVPCLRWLWPSGICNIPISHFYRTRVRSLGMLVSN